MDALEGTQEGVGGGLVRDSREKFVFGYAEPFGVITSMQAELRALLWGVRHCVIRGCLELHLEADSLTLVHIVQGTSACPWRLQRDLDELMMFKQYFTSITHCYREANAPADHLANFGADSSTGHVFNTFSELPQLVRGAIRLDRLGFPTFRTRCLA